MVCVNHVVLQQQMHILEALSMCVVMPKQSFTEPDTAYLSSTHLACACGGTRYLLLPMLENTVMDTEDCSLSYPW